MHGGVDHKVTRKGLTFRVTCTGALSFLGASFLL
jgi:hypothetical protein